MIGRYISVDILLLRSSEGCRTGAEVDRHNVPGSRVFSYDCRLLVYYGLFILVT